MFSFSRNRTFGWVALCLFLWLTASASAQVETALDNAEGRLLSSQNVDGSFGAIEDLRPRDSALTVLALAGRPASEASMAQALAYLDGVPEAATDFRSHRALALAAGGLDPSALLSSLAEFDNGGGMGAFQGHQSSLWDTSLAIQALSLEEATYQLDVVTLLDYLQLHQRPDGGWGFAAGDDSDVFYSGESLQALAGLEQLSIGSQTLDLVASYLLTLQQPDGGFGSVIDTAVAYRGLIALGRNPAEFPFGSPVPYLLAQQQADGSWGGDVFTTAQVVRVLRQQRPNLVIESLTVHPESVRPGESVEVSVTVRNVGPADAEASSLDLRLASADGELLSEEAVLALAAGSDEEFLITVGTLGLTGSSVDLIAIADSRDAVAELDEEDNTESARLTLQSGPDLALFASDVSLSVSDPEPGTPFELRFNARNLGETEVPSFEYRVSLLQMGQSPQNLAQGSAGPAAPGGAHLVSVPLTFDEGEYRVEVELDPDNGVDEESEANNRMTLTFFVVDPSRADLAVLAADLSILADNTDAGSSATVDAVVRNLGSRAGAADLVIYQNDPSDGGAELARVPVDVPANGNQSIQTPVILGPGAHSLTLVVDPEQQLSELDEGNNRLQRYFRDLADLAAGFDNMELLPGNPQAGESVTVTVTVRNAGSAEATNADVEVWDGDPQGAGVLLFSHRIEELKPAANQRLSFQWAVTEGLHPLTVLLDPQDTVIELSESNNQSLRTVAVDRAFGPDLRVADVDLTALVTDAAESRIQGVVSLNLENAGDADVGSPFEVRLFEDRDGDGRWATGEPVLASQVVTGPLTVGAIENVALAVDSTLAFHHAPVWAEVDAGEVIEEQKEGNNHRLIFGECQVPAPAGSLDPVEIWYRSGLEIETAPVVAQLSDDNGDGSIDSRDIADVVFHTVDADGNAIRALNGLDGTDLWTFRSSPANPLVGHLGQLAAADLDGDGKVEIVGHRRDGRLLALEHDGSLKWIGDPVEGVADRGLGSIVAGDLNADGVPELVIGRAVVSNTGELIALGTGNVGQNFNFYGPFGVVLPPGIQAYPHVVIADVDLDGIHEIVAGDTLYRLNGNTLEIVWDNTVPDKLMNDGFSAVANLDGDAEAEIVYVSSGQIMVLEHTGAVKRNRRLMVPFVPFQVPTYWGSPPLITDLDGDGGAEIVVGTATELIAYNANLGVKWRQTLGAQDFGGVHPPVAFDFDDDGVKEVLWQARTQGRDATRLVMVDGATGAALTEITNTSKTGTEFPVIADVTGDGRADLLLPSSATFAGDTSTQGLHVYTHPSWSGARPLWNQYSYRAGDVSLDGSVHASAEFTADNGVRVQPRLPAPPVYLPNLTVSRPVVGSAGADGVPVTLRVGNGGRGPVAPGVEVQLLDVATGEPAGSARTEFGLRPGEHGELQILWQLAAPAGLPIRARIDADHQVQECDEGDNDVDFELTETILSDLEVPASGVSVSGPLTVGRLIPVQAATANVGPASSPEFSVRFYQGDPSLGSLVGGVISQALTAGEQSSAEVLWDTIGMAPGIYSLYAVIDQEDLVPELSEGNNSGLVQVELEAATQPDLVLTELRLVPETVSAGEPTELIATVTNRGVELSGGFEVAFLVNQAEQGRVSSPLSLAAGESRNLSFTLATGALAGTLPVAAVVDPDGVVAEYDEGNNRAEHILQVGDSAIELTVTTDRVGYGVQEDVAITVVVENAAGAVDAEVTVRILDPFGVEVAAVAQQSANLAAGTSELGFLWNTGSTFAGTYTVWVEASGTGVETAAGSLFAIAGDSQVRARLFADRDVYAPRQTAVFTGAVIHQGSNQPIDNLGVWLTVRDSVGNEVFNAVLAISQLLPGATHPLAIQWPIANGAGGDYGVTLEVRTDSDLLLAFAETTVTVEDSADTGVGLNGSLEVSPDTVGAGDSVLAAYQLVNNGNSDIAIAVLRLDLVRLADATVVGSLSRAMSIDRDQTLHGSFGVATADLEEEEYLLTLVAELPAGDRRLDSHGLTVARGLSVADVSALEGDAGPSDLVFEVRLSSFHNQPVTVDYATADGTAVANSDYLAAAGTLTFQPGELIQTVTVTVLGDTDVEPAESFLLGLENPTGALLGDSQALATLIDEEGCPGPELLVNGGGEGESLEPWVATSAGWDLRFADPVPLTGGAYLAFPGGTDSELSQVVDLSAFSEWIDNGSQAFAVSGFMRPAEAIVPDSAGLIVEYLDQDLNLLASQDLGTVESSGGWRALADQSPAPVGSRWLRLRLLATTSADGAGVYFDQLSVRSVAIPVLTVGAEAFHEGSSGSTPISVPLQLSCAAPEPFVISYATADGSAQAGSDYQGASGDLSIAAGAASVDLPLELVGDGLDEPDESLFVDLSTTSSLVLLDSRLEITVLDDDGQVSLASDDITVHEIDQAGAVASFAVSLSAISGRTVTVAYQTETQSGPGRAQPGADFENVSGTLTFPPGTTEQIVDVPLVGDLVGEADETFTLRLSAAQNAELADPLAVATIEDNDEVLISIDSPVVLEGDSGSPAVTFTVTLSLPSDLEVQVSYATSDLEATAGSDYVAAAGTLIFPPGTTHLPLPVTILPDVEKEANERVLLTLSGAVHGTLALPEGIGTLFDDDGILISVSEASAFEGSSEARVPVILNKPAAVSVSVDVTSVEGTALDGSDFVAGTETLTFAPGVTRVDWIVPLVNDEVAEAVETFSVTLSSPVSDAVLLDDQAEITVYDDDLWHLNSAADQQVLAGCVELTSNNFGFEQGSAWRKDKISLSENFDKTFTIYVGDRDSAQNGLVFALQNQGPTALLDNFHGYGPGLAPSIAVEVDTIDDSQSGFHDDIPEDHIAVHLNGVMTGAGRPLEPVPARPDGGNIEDAQEHTLRVIWNAESQQLDAHFDGVQRMVYGSDLVNNIFAGGDQVFYGLTAGSWHPPTRHYFCEPDICVPGAESTVSVGNAYVTEGDAGSVIASFPVSLSCPSDQAVTVDWSTLDWSAAALPSGHGSATSGVDYSATGGTVTLQPGETSAWLHVTVAGDTAPELDEAFGVELSNSSVSVRHGRAVGQIASDDVIWNLNGAALENLPEGCIRLTPDRGRSAGSAWRSDPIDLNDHFDMTFDVYVGTRDNGADGLVFALQNQSPDALGADGGGLGWAGISPSLGVELDTRDNGVHDPSEDHLAVVVNGDPIDHGGTATPALASGANIEDGNRHSLRVVWNSDAKVLDVHFEGDERIYHQRDVPAEIFGGESEVWWGFTGGNGLDNEHYFCPTALCLGDDGNPLISVGDVELVEGDSGSSLAQFPLTLHCPSLHPVTVRAATVATGTGADSAQAGTDYSSVDQVFIFAPGETSKTVSVEVFGDVEAEITELFEVVLSNAVGGPIRYGRGLGRIISDDVLISIQDPAQTESDLPLLGFFVDVELGNPLADAVTLTYTTADGSAVAGQDYVAASGSVTFAPGQTQARFVLQLHGDALDEGDEVFFIDFDAPEDNLVADRRVELLIQDDDACRGPNLLENPSSELDPTTHGWTQISGEWLRAQRRGAQNGEWYFWSGFVAAGELIQDVDVTSFAQRIDLGLQPFVFEGYTLTDNERVSDPGRVIVEYRDASNTQVLASYDSGDVVSTVFWQRLEDLRTAPAGTRFIRVRLLTTRFTGTNNDASFDNLSLRPLDWPTFSVNDVIVTEGESGSRLAPVTVNLSCPVAFPVSVDYLTRDGSARAGTDYQPVSGRLTLPPGQITATVEVPVLGDTVTEGDESFALVLANPVSSAIADGEGEITIAQDEVLLTIDDVSVVEGNSGTTPATFTLSLSGPSTLPISVDYRTSNGTATGGDSTAEEGTDYVAGEGTITLAPGQTSARLVVQVLGDTDVEANEIFKINLSNPVNVSLQESRGQGMILQDDIALSVADGTAVEGNSGVTPMSFKVSLGIAAEQVVSVDWSTRDGLALAGSDYQAAAGTVTLAPGETTAFIEVPVVGDTEQEGGETFFLDLSNAMGAYLTDVEATGFIGDDDECPSPNLLTNGSADSPLVEGEIPGWSEVSGGNWTALDSGIGPYQGAAFFFPGDAAQAELSQEIDVSTYAQYIDTGAQRFYFEGWMHSFDQVPVDTGRLVVEYLDDSGAVLDTFDTGDTSNVSGWQRHSDLRSAPVGARTVRVRMIATRQVSSGNLDVFFDALVLRSLGTPVLQFTDLDIPEGDEGSQFVPLPVSLSCVAPERTVEVSWQLVDGTAVAGEDYVAGLGTLVFAPGTTEQEIQLEILGDYQNELAETFEVRFSAESNGALLDSAAEIRLRDADPGAPPRPGVFSIYTLDEEFDTGVMVKVNHDAPGNNQLQLDEEGSTFPFIWVAASGRGTIVKIDTRDGTILGEYSTNPDNRGDSSPSRTTVGLDGSVWVGNRNDRGSVAHIGLPELNQCVDRNGNGFIDTSSGYGDVLAWPNGGNEDSQGGVSTAEDECILHFVRVESSMVRHLSVDADNNLWVSGRFGTNDQVFQRIDGRSGQILQTEQMPCGGYGGFVDKNNVLWSASRDASLLRWEIDAGADAARCIGSVEAYGLGIDSDGFVFVTDLTDPRMWKVSPDGNTVQEFPIGFAGAQGAAVDRNGDVWLSSIWRPGRPFVGRAKNDGTYLGTVTGVPIGSSGVAIDAAGKVWTANYASSTVSRIDPNLGPVGSDGVTPVGEVELVIDLPLSTPYNYSDMTGFVALQSTVPQGTFAVIQDSEILGAEWGLVTWNTEPEAFVPEGGAILVEVRAADTVTGLGGAPWMTIDSGVAFEIFGRFLQVRATLRAAPDGTSPVLSDLRIGVRDDAQVSIGDASAVEGDGGSAGRLTFPVTFAEPTVLDTTLDYTVIAGTASEGDDFVAQSGTLTVPAGDTQAEIVVDLVADDRMENEETLTVVLSDPRNAVLVDAEAKGTITDDDVPVLRLTKADAVVAGGFEAEPGSEVEYTLLAENIGTGIASATQLVDEVPAQTALVAGSLSTDRGSVAGETPPAVNLGDLAPGDTATVRFRVMVNDPFGGSEPQVENQATVTAVELPALLSDDPDTVALGDATVTPVASDQTVRCIDEPFDQPLDDQWLSAFIGDADQGTVEVIDGALRLSGNGSELYHGADHGHFAYREVEGDFRAQLTFTGLPEDLGGQYRKACLMVRDGLDPQAARFMACWVPHFPDPDGEVQALQFDHRPAFGAPALELASTEQGVTEPVQVALTRRGDAFTVSFSRDGVEWIEPVGGVGGTAEVVLPSTLQVGLMVASYDSAQTFSVEVDDLSICSPNNGGPADPPDPPVCDPDQRMDIGYLIDLSESMTADFSDGSGTKLAAAREALRLIHDQIEARQDGSRTALLSFAGGDTVAENLAGSLNIREPLSTDLSSVAQGILDLDSDDVAPLASTPTALAWAGVREQVAPLFDSANRPVLIWVTDGVPNIDGEGRGPAQYRMDEIQELSLRDAGGNFLSWGQAAWLGRWNAGIQTFDGEPMANAMRELERLKAQVPDLLIYGIAIHGNGVELGAFSDDLVDFSAYVSGGRSYQGFDQSSLEAAASALLGDLLCNAVPESRVGDRVWNDLNGDGVQDAGEPGLTQVTVELLDGEGNVVATETTDGQGHYLLEGVMAGNHSLRVDASTLPGGLDQATFDADGVATLHTASFSLDPWQVNRQLDFGYRAEPVIVEQPPISSACPVDGFDDGVLNGGDSPFPWQLSAIGDASSGDAVETAGRLELSSNGSAMWTDDNVHFVYHPVSGDFRLEVDVVDVPVDPGGNRFRKAGAMIRKDLDIRSPRVMVQYLPDSRETGPLVQFGFRDQAGGQSFVLSDPLSRVELPIRLALEKRGTTYSAWYSTDGGQSWQQQTTGGAGSSVNGTVELDLGDQPLVGLAAASYNTAQELTVAFDDLAVCSPTDVPAPEAPAGSACDDQLPMDVAVVLDLSGSMAADYSGGPSRFEAARLALYDLRDRLAARADGSRLALVTYAGSSDAAVNRETAVRVLSGLTSDLGSLSTLLDGLRVEDIDPAATTASPLALQQLEQLLSQGGRPGHRATVVWLTDELPNVDLQGRGPYAPELSPQSFQLTDADGAYLPWSQVAWQGPFVGAFGHFAGESVAGAMAALEALRVTVPTVRIFSLALQSDGTVSAPFDEALLEYAAWLTAGDHDSADNTQDLLLAGGRLWDAMTCSGDP